MRKNQIITLDRGREVELDRWNSAKYIGIEGNEFSFIYDGCCKINIPVQRRQIQLVKYQFEVEQSSGDNITLKYIGFKRKHPCKCL
ncbi:MAG TPA: hypothetical protein VJ485_03310 [archaeon]|jgi:hypothetical protein|nr:hypothetical protein [archaeon]